MRFAVRNWFAWTSERISSAQWRDWAGPCREDDFVPPVALPLSLRRRATPMGQTLLAGALGFTEIVQEARYVQASRHGEFSRARQTLLALAQEEELSPAEFSMSVHHGLAGLLSIHAQNRQGHIALAAGTESFACGLLEAAACIAERPQTPILLLYADEKLPHEFAGLAGPESALPCVMVLGLTAPRMDGDDIILTQEPASRPGDPSPSAALDFLRFLLSGEAQAVSHGEHWDWTWRHA
ncbi:beta-ketoacyl synthase chain length factor [Bosea caraganae]|nr:beta-ketoacyl synthase chain length factor [Bosea caraganae]